MSSLVCIYNVCNFVMQQKIDDIVNLRQDPRPITVKVQWGGPQAPQPLAYQTEIDGVIGHYLKVVTPKLCNISKFPLHLLCMCILFVSRPSHKSFTLYM